MQKWMVFALALAAPVIARADEIHLHCTTTHDYFTPAIDLDINLATQSVVEVETSFDNQLSTQKWQDGKPAKQFKLDEMQFVSVSPEFIRYGFRPSKKSDGSSDEVTEIDRRTQVLTFPLNHQPYECSKRKVTPREQLPQAF